MNVHENIKLEWTLEWRVALKMLWTCGEGGTRNGE